MTWGKNIPLNHELDTFTTNKFEYKAITFSTDETDIEHHQKISLYNGFLF